MLKKLNWTAVAMAISTGLFALTALWQSTAHAFKPFSHQYFAKIALEDAKKDCKVDIHNTKGSSIEKLGSFEVRADFCKAVRQGASMEGVYYNGVCGPDCQPDMFTGQALAHTHSSKPITAFGSKQDGHVESEHGSDAWLNLVWNGAFKNPPKGATTQAKAKAYAIGYLTHAAGDMFAHTYVNAHADGPFALDRGNIIRHVMMEGYLANRTPKHNKIQQSHVRGLEPWIYDVLIKQADEKGLMDPEHFGNSTYLSIPFLFLKLKHWLDGPAKTGNFPGCGGKGSRGAGSQKNLDKKAQAAQLKFMKLLGESGARGSKPPKRGKWVIKKGVWTYQPPKGSRGLASWAKKKWKKAKKKAKKWAGDAEKKGKKLIKDAKKKGKKFVKNAKKKAKKLLDDAEKKGNDLLDAGKEMFRAALCATVHGIAGKKNIKAYAKQWQSNIDAGLKDWVKTGQEINFQLALVSPYAPKGKTAGGCPPGEKTCGGIAKVKHSFNKWKEKHLCKMIGIPIAGCNAYAKFNSIIAAIASELRDTIIYKIFSAFSEMMGNITSWAMDEVCKANTDKTCSDYLHMFVSPEKNFDRFLARKNAQTGEYGCLLNSHKDQHHAGTTGRRKCINRTEFDKFLALDTFAKTKKDGIPKGKLQWRESPLAFNAVQISKMVMLSKKGLQDMVYAAVRKKCNGDSKCFGALKFKLKLLRRDRNIMLGWLNSMDAGRQWCLSHTHQDDKNNAHFSYQTTSEKTDNNKAIFARANNAIFHTLFKKHQGIQPGDCANQLHKGASELVNAQTGMCLQPRKTLMKNGFQSSKNGIPIVQMRCDGSALQKWTLDTEKNRLWNIVTKKCLDVKGYKKKNKSVLHQWQCHNKGNQKWAINSGGNIIGAASGRCIDIPSGKKTPNLQVQIYDCHGGKNQKFVSANNIALTGIFSALKGGALKNLKAIGGLMGKKNKKGKKAVTKPKRPVGKRLKKLVSNVKLKCPRGKYLHPVSKKCQAQWCGSKHYLKKLANGTNSCTKCSKNKIRDPRNPRRCTTPRKTLRRPIRRRVSPKRRVIKPKKRSTYNRDARE